jgi:alpha-tubulin suppressor-like RCC1 family protein
VLEVVAGGYATCVRTDSQWLCAGRNDFGQLARGASSAFEWELASPEVPGADLQVALGIWQSCFTAPDGIVWCSGDPSLGRLGTGTVSPEDCSSGPCFSSPVPVQNLDEAALAAAGTDFTCVQRRDGTLHCFGTDARGQLGNSQGEVGNCPTETGDVSCSLSPVKAYLLVESVALRAGEDFACTLAADGRVSCWGDNQMGQLSLGKSSDFADFPAEAYGLENPLSASETP